MFKSLIFAVLAVAAQMAQAAPTAEWVAPYYPATQWPKAGEYIVRLRDDYSLADHIKAVPILETITEITETSFKWGYSAKFSDAVLDLVRRDQGVLFVEQNSGGEWHDVQNSAVTSDSLEETTKDIHSTLKPRTEQRGVGYALRYDSSKVKNPPGSASYYYRKGAGTGVNVYVMDSGINVGAAEFEGRASNKINYSDEGYDDTLDHGTRVASILGGKTYGVTKKPNLYSVKFSVGGDPDTAKFIQALGDIVNEHNKLKSGSSFKGSVINMSFSVGASQAASQALENAQNAGISMVAAAGNDGVNAKGTFPCNNGYVLCVGGSTAQYTRYKSSNFGQAVSILAPGQNVDSLKNDGTATTSTGTSFAAPQVAGIFAIYYDFEGKGMNPSLARQRLETNADKDYLTGLDPTQINRLANTGFQKASGGKPYLQ